MSTNFFFVIVHRHRIVEILTAPDMNSWELENAAHILANDCPTPNAMTPVVREALRRYSRQFDLYLMECDDSITHDDLTQLQIEDHNYLMFNVMTFGIPIVKSNQLDFSDKVK